MAKKRQSLHQPPEEFAQADKARRGWDWMIKREREARRSKREREMVMPAHRPPNPARVIYYDKNGACYESREETLDRVWRQAHRKANKIIHPLYHKIWDHISSHS